MMTVRFVMRGSSANLILGDAAARTHSPDCCRTMAGEHRAIDATLAAPRAQLVLN
jgi:hypothetical protein